MVVQQYPERYAATSEFWWAAAHGRQKEHDLDACGEAMQRAVHFQGHFVGAAEVPTQGQVVRGPSGRGG